MKELDFDELDRAVNNLMGDIPSTVQAPSESDGTRILTIPTTLANGTSPVMPTSSLADAQRAAAETEVRTASSLVPSSQRETAPAPVISATPASSVADTSAASIHLPLTTRRSGRFMDVVHPSSDMKNPSNAPTGRPLSRNAPTIEPLTSSSVVYDERENSEDEAIESVDTYDSSSYFNEPVLEQPATAVVDYVAEPEPLPATHTADDWPDPLSGFMPEPDTVGTIEQDTELTPDVASLEDTQGAIAADAADTPEHSSEEDDDDDDLFTIDDSEPEVGIEPLMSPFLTDTKVEKRPLGGPSNDVSDEQPSEVSVEASVETPSYARMGGGRGEEGLTQSNPDDQLPADPVASVPLPAELQSDLMAVESDTTISNTVVARPEVAQSTSRNTVQALAPSSGPTSIQQQYQETVTTGDQTSGAIYDTEAYHQPLVHPGKKKSGWAWVIWVIVILVVGAGGGAALYLLKII